MAGSCCEDELLTLILVQNKSKPHYEVIRPGSLTITVKTLTNNDIVFISACVRCGYRGWNGPSSSVLHLDLTIFCGMRTNSPVRDPRTPLSEIIEGLSLIDCMVYGQVQNRNSSNCSVLSAANAECSRYQKINWLSRYAIGWRGFLSPKPHKNKCECYL